MKQGKAANPSHRPFGCKTHYSSPNTKTHDQTTSPAALFRPVRRLSDCVQLGSFTDAVGFSGRCRTGRITNYPPAANMGQTAFWTGRFVLVGLCQFIDSGGGRHPIAHAIFDIRRQRDLRVELRSCLYQLWLGVFLVQKRFASRQNSRPRQIAVLY